MNTYVLFHYLTLYNAGLVLWWRTEVSLALFCILWHLSALTLHGSEGTFSKDHWSQQGHHFDRLRLSSCLVICKWGFYYYHPSQRLNQLMFVLVCSCHFWNSFCFAVWLLFSGRTVWVVQNFQWTREETQLFLVGYLCSISLRNT